jgi:hypothetical protein
MPSLSTSVDDDRDRRRDKTARPAAVGGARADGRPKTSQAAVEALVRPPDFPAVEEFLQLLARAVRQFHTYPATSPLCTDAIAACHKVLASLEGRDRLACRVTPRELIVNDIGIGAGTIVEHEVVRRLNRAHVAALDIDRSASPRDLSRFSSDVLRCDDLVRTRTTLAELLAEHGVETIATHLVHRAEMLEIGTPLAARSDLVMHERERRQALLAAAGPVSYLYPPDKGWVRLDPSSIFDTISLVDLAILVEDPGDIAAMLVQLTDDEAGAESRDGALQQKFSDVATLLAALDPPLARVMFSKLARAVLDLAPERRTDLLRRTILPGLLDGRAGGTVLRDFPNDDLAESLCLLMDLETAAPELLTTAMDRLDLPADRRQVVAPLMEARLRRGETPAATPPVAGRERDVDRYVRRLIRVNPSEGKSFAEFAAFDLSLDEQTTATLGRIQESIVNTDVPVAQLRFLLNLVRLEPNPALADVFLRRTLTALAELEGAARQQELAAWAAQYGRLADALRESRPDVADAIANALAAFCTPERAMVLSDLYAMAGDGRARANLLVEAFGEATAPAFVALLDDSDMRSRARGLVPLMCEHGRLLAPALAARLGHTGAVAARAIIKVLGLAGPGYEHALAGQLQHGDEQTAREALQALAHIGSPKAAGIVGLHLRQGASSVRAAAEEALRHFPPAAADAALRDLLASRDFVLQHPEIAMRLLDRAEHTGLTDLEPAMRALVPLRFHFWNPALVRVALKARTMIGRR